MTNVKTHRLPPSSFPLEIEALHPVTGRVVWSTVLHEPAAGEVWAGIEIPPLRQQLGHPVDIRITYGDGTVSELPASGPGGAQ